VYFSPHGGEGFGITLAEALACNVPVVTTDYTSSREFIGKDERGILVDRGKMVSMVNIQRPIPSVKECADAMERIMTGEFVGMESRQFILDNYGKQKVENMWIDLVEKHAYRRDHVENQLV